MKHWIWFVGIMAAVAVHASPEWPAGADYRLEWKFAADPQTQFVRVPDYRRFSQLIPKTFVICDETGHPTEWTQRTGDDGKPELWFAVAGAHRYFSYWGKVQKTKLNITEATIPEIGSAAPAATPGEMVRRPTWRVKDGVVEQTTAGQNLCLVSQPEFTDFEFTCRVKATAEAALAVRGRAEDVDTSGVYWMMGCGKRKAGTGDNQLWGAVRDATPGPGLVAQEWNDLKVVAQGPKLTFTVNGELAKSVELPAGVATHGHIALATYGGPAQFADVKVTSGGKVLFADDFAGKELAGARWRNPEGEPCRGFVRVINAADKARNFLMDLAFHRDPWASRGIAFDAGATLPGQSTGWLWPAGIPPRPPVTVTIREVSNNLTGRVEYVSALADAQPLIVAELPADSSMELQHRNAYRAEEIQSDAALGRATLDAVRAMKFKGQAPRRFPTGHPMGNDYDLQAGRVLGFNMLFGLPDHLTRQKFDALGFKYIFGYTHLLTAQGKGVGYRTVINLSEMEKLAALYKKADLLDSVYMISVFDEPGTNIKDDVKHGLGHLEADPDAWNQIITTAGLKPADLIHPDDLPPADADPLSTNYWKHVRGWQTADRELNPLGLYRTMLVDQAIYPCRFRNARTAIRAAFGTNVWVTANVHADHWFRGTLTDIEPWGIYSRLEALDVPQACDYNVGWPQNEEFLIDSMRCALRPHDKPVNAYLAAQAAYMTRSPASLKLRAFSAIGAGARSLSFYEWGPRRFATENWYDTDREKLRVIGQINYAVGWVEDILLEGRPQQAKVAIMFSQPGDLWDLLDIGNVATAERRAMFHLLRSLHQQVDFINDDRLPTRQELDGYRVIFMSQRCITDKAVEILRSWVERGGTLVASLACGQLDELAQPARKMPKLFGLESIELIATNRPVVTPAITTRQSIANVKLAGATRAAQFEDGTPAVLTKTFGKGKLIYTAFLLGHAYHTGKIDLENDVLLGMQESVRELVAPWLPAAECATDNPLIGARLIESPHGRVVVLVNSTGQPAVPAVRVTVQATGVQSVESLEQGKLVFQEAGNKLSFQLPLGLTDIVRIK